MSKNDGGPAFPCTNEQFTLGNPQTGDAWAGMTLRDWFAGQAIAGMMASDDDCWPQVSRAAQVAYQVADAMLAERAKP